MDWQKRVWMADCRTTSLPDSTVAVIYFPPPNKKVHVSSTFLFEFVHSCTTLVYIIGCFLGGQIVLPTYLSGDVRTMQFVFLAQTPREMSQTDRIHPRYLLLRVRVSIRPRYFVNAKKNIVHVCCLLRSAPLRPDEQLNSKP